MRFLVTGGSGFIGTHLCRRLAAEGHEVVVLDLRDPETRISGVDYVIGDVRKPADLDRTIPGVHTVFHLAAIVSIPLCQQDPYGSYETNLMGTLRVIEAVRRESERQGRKVRHVFASSAATYGYLGDDGRFLREDQTADPPISFYGAQKLGSEHAIRQSRITYGIPSVIFRFFNVFGPGQDPKSPYSGVITLFTTRLRDKQPLTVFGDGEQTRDFISVHDLVDALCAVPALPEASCDGSPINLGRQRKLTVNALGSLMMKVTGTEVPVERQPPREGDILHSCASIERARAVLGWEPRVSLETGLAELLKGVGAFSA
ncbi:MAG: NAD-dependent epimerase/dehydratase family protein [Bdellovibrionales bacterium]|nr:NAD-dependent epimerase/dehydratase family protein [Bdellovibrionales bacterium]